MFVTRTVSGVALLIIIIVSVVAGGPVWLGITGLLSIAATYELFKALGLQQTVLLHAALIADAAVYTVLYMGYSQLTMFVLIIYFIILMTIYVAGWPRFNSGDIAYSLFGFVYACLCLSYLYQIRAFDDGIYYIWLVFISSWGSDTCAYLTGILIGKHKLPSTLSPKKTIEGCIGGIAGAALLAMGYGLYIMNVLDSSNPYYLIFACICAVGAVMSQIGDLAASAVKRNNDIKDYGRLIPGHGGIMDRFDSVMYVAPIVYYGMVLYAGV